MYLQKKANKYGAKTSTFNGVNYHSKLEARYAQDFDLMLKAGELKAVDRQVKLDLRVNGIHITNYYMDFALTHNDDSIELVEIKGYATDTWRIKFKLTEALLFELYPDKDVKLTVYKQ